MKNIGTIARAVLSLTLSVAALAACGNNHDDNTGPYNGSGTNVVAFPNGTTCGRPIQETGWNRYGSGAGGNYYHQYSFNRNFRQNVRGQARYVGSPYGNQGYNVYGGYGNFGGDGFQGCPIGDIAACDTYSGGGMTCLPAGNLPLQNLAGYSYGPSGNFGYNQGITSCGGGYYTGAYGGNNFSCYNQIAQTCVVGMPNGCANGQCIPSGNGSVGVCAIQ